jgi:uncharacterized protein YccT (UPF0319 family)
MMTLKKTLLAGLMLAPTLAYSAVNLNVPVDVQMLTVNGQDVGFSSLGFDHKESVTLNDGVNQVVFRISKVVADGGNKGTKYTSVPMVATFDSSDSNLFIKVPKLITLSQGSQFNDKPSFSITDGNQVVSGLEKGKINAGLKFYADIVAEVERFNRSDEPASLKNFQVAKPAAATTTTVTATTTSYSASPDIEKFKQDFAKFSKEEKQAFLSWAINNIN